MKKVYPLSIILFLSGFLTAQDCFWIKSAGGSNYESGNDIARDASGNLIAIGNYSSNSISFGTTTLTNSSGGTDDIFVAKYTSNGNIIWGKTWGGSGSVMAHEEGQAVATDQLNNIYITGSFASSKLIIGADTLVNATPGNYATFIAKLDSSGNAVWAKTTGGSRTSDDKINAICFDGSGNIYVTGQFHSTNIVIGTTMLSKMTSSGSDIFIAKYDLNGNPLWALSAGGKGLSTFDAGRAIVANSNTVYINGTFSGNTFYFGTDSITTTSNTSFFLLKCSAAGNFQWAANGNKAEAYGDGVAMDSNEDCYITGQFQFDTLKFGSTQLPSYGNPDLFVAKYSASGNILWAQNAGNSGGNNKKGFDVFCDASDNLYMSGFFQSNSISFGSVTLNHNGNSSDISSFAVKFDPSGTATTGFCNSGGTISYFRSIVADNSGRVYFTGDYNGNVFFQNSDTLNSAGAFDFLIGGSYPFSVSVTSTAVSCFGGSNGSATANITGGVSPFTFLWTPTGDTTAAINNLSAGYDTVWVTDVNGCLMMDVENITQPNAIEPAICMVSVDSSSQHNIIVWDKSIYTNVDSFIVYREITTNNYQPVARIHFDSLSQFIDTVQTLYFPNTGNPNNGTYRYKLGVHDTCGNYSVPGPYHNTIYMLNSNGSFYWTTPYTIENGSNPVTNYVLYRDDNSTGNWQSVASVAGTQQVISDPLYAIYQNTASWRVQTVWGITCNPTLKTTSAYNSSFSNIITNNPTVGIHENVRNTIVTVSPNPGNGIFIVSSNAQIQKLEVKNLTGETMYSANNNMNGKDVTADLTALPAGIYFFYVTSENQVISKKIIKQ